MSVILLLSRLTQISPGGGLGDDSGGNEMELIWRSLGACRGLDPDMFFPETEDQADVAKMVCSGCDVRISCLEHALASREKVGVWGGTTERDRRRIIRHRRRVA